MPIAPNHPFAQLISPQSLADAVARSERLGRLQRRVCRPLDKPLIALRTAAEARPAPR